MAAPTPMQVFKEGAVLLTMCLVAVLGPATLADPTHRPGIGFWLALAAAWAILGVDAVKAWRLGRHTPAALRLVVPAILCAASLAAWRAGLWDGFFTHLRGG